MNIMRVKQADGSITSIPFGPGEKGDKGDKGDSGVYVGSGDMPDGYNVQIDPDGEALVNIGGINVTAEVGQTIVVKAVDENGKPTEWEAVDHQPRTHWSEASDGEILFQESTVAWDETTDFVGIMETSAPLVIGKTYKVGINGAEYICRAFNYLGMPAIGNETALSDDGFDTGEPFAICNMDGGCIYIDSIILETGGQSGSAVVSIVEYNEIVHAIPDKFIEKDFRITVTSKADLSGQESDKTHDEIKAAYKHGKNITVLHQGITSDTFYQFVRVEDNQFLFSTVILLESTVTVHMLTIKPDNSVTISTKHIY